MIGKHVVIDTLDNFKTKLSLIPSSAIVLIKDVGQIYAHGTYFGAQKTYSLLTKTADGLAPKGGTSASSLIKDGESEWVLTVTNGENPTWRKLPANAFSSSLYTLPSATASDLGGIKVGQVYTATFNDLVGQYYKINVDKNGLAYVHVPWVNNPYTASGSGITLKDNVFSLSLNSVTKLDLAIGNKIYAVSLDKNGKLCVSVPWVDTNNIFTGATETKNGSSGMVPAPIANQHRYFLRGDGTWVKPNLSDLNDDVVNGKYLPLSGGTISNEEWGESLIVKRESNYGNSVIRFINSKGELGHIGIGGNEPYNPVFTDKNRDDHIILHSGNYSSYALPINGGLMGGAIQWGSASLPVSISTSSGYLSLDSKGSEICIAGGNDTDLLVNYRKSALGYAPSAWHIFKGDATTYATMYVGNIFSNGKSVIHSGNIGSQSVEHSNTSNKFLSKRTDELGSYDFNNPTYSLVWHYGSATIDNAPSEFGYGGILTFFQPSISLQGQFVWNVNHNTSTPTKSLLFRASNNLGWANDWKTIAFTDGNVESANRLKTPRTIWGQSFDGTDNVKGVLFDVSQITFDSNKAYGIFKGNFFSGALTETDLAYYAEGKHVFYGGNVGISVANPSCKLDVNGEIKAVDKITVSSSLTGGSAEVYINNDMIEDDVRRSYICLDPTLPHGSGMDYAYIAALSNGNALFDIANNGTLDIAATMYIKRAGNVGIGTGSPAYKLDVNGDIATSLYLRIKAWSGYGSGICSMWYNGTTTQLVLDSGAVFGYNVGISGTLHMTNDHKIYWHDDSANYYISSPNTATSAMLEYKAYGGHRFYGGNVGIGVESPKYKLDVSGSISATDGIVGNIFYFKSNGEGKGWFGSPNNTGATDFVLSVYDGAIRAYTNDVERIRINSAGNIGIGTASPETMLHVAGGIYSANLRTSSTILSDNYHLVYNCGSFSYVSSSLTGAIVIKLPITSSLHDMVNVEISIYEYKEDLGASKIIVGGHPWLKHWYCHTCSIIGNYNKGIRLGIYDGKYCIILGNNSTKWAYPGVYVTHIGTVYDDYKTSYLNKCTFSIVTDESGFSALVTPPNVVKATSANISTYLRTQTYDSTTNWYDTYLFYTKWAMRGSGSVLDLKCDGYQVRADIAKILDTSRNIYGNNFDGSADIGSNAVGSMKYLLFRNLANDGNAGYIGRGSSNSNNLEFNNYTSTGKIILATGNRSNDVELDASGSLGIGISPSYKFDIRSTSTTASYDLHYYNSSTKCSLFIGTDLFWYGNAKTSNSTIFHVQAGTTTDGSGGKSVFKILGDGNVIASTFVGNLSGKSSTTDMISHSTYYYNGNLMKNTTTSKTIFGDTSTANYLFPSFMESHPKWSGFADVINFTGYCMWGGTQFATEYNAINPRVAIRKYNQTRSNWGDWTEFITENNNYKVRDSGNSSEIAFYYSTGGFTSNPSWLAAWDSYKLTYVSPSVLDVNYASKSTYLYACDAYSYGGSNPYYMKMRYNTNSDNRWYLSVYPETPKAVSVDWSYGSDSVDGYHISVGTSAGTNSSTIYFVT